MVATVNSVALDARLAELARRRRVDLAEISKLLLALSAGKGWLELGFGSLGDYADERLGFSARKARDLVAIAAKAETCPELRAAWEGGELDWTRLRTIVPVLDAGNEGEWLAKARMLSVRQLEFAVAAAKGESPKGKVTLELSAEDLADLEELVRAYRRELGEHCPREQAVIALMKRGAAAQGKSSAPAFKTVIYRCAGCEAASVETREGALPVAASTAARARCDSEVVDGRRPGPVTSEVPSARRRFVLDRDHHRCRVRGCSGRDWVEVHHIRPRAEGGGHEAWNLITLCSAHHAAVHEGRLDLAHVGMSEAA